MSVALVDSGIDIHHPDFAGRSIVVKSFTGTDATDHTGHGTHCAGVIWRVTPETTLYMAKVGQGDSVLSGLRWAVKSGCRVICLPLESYESHPEYVAVIRAAVAGGTIVVAAAGNGSWRPKVVKPPSFPASLPDVIAVGALNEKGEIARFSNDADRFAIGVRVISSLPAHLGHRGARSGTSVAAARVAGEVALRLHGEI